jgi:AcrR family transcriptional regulator
MLIKNKTETLRDKLRTTFISRLNKQSYASVSFRELAADCGCSVGAVQYHFGTKEEALYDIWDYYCDKCLQQLKDLDNIKRPADTDEVYRYIQLLSKMISKLQLDHTGLNQAMNQKFVEKNNVHRTTLQIMKQLSLNIRQKVQFVHKRVSQEQCDACAQILVTINLNRSLGGCPLLPSDDERFHKFIAHSAQSLLTCS